MNKHERLLFRLAGRIQGRLSQRSHSRWSHLEDQLRRLRETTNRLRELERQLGLCRQRAWHGAARDVAQRVEYALYDFDSHQAGLRRAINASNALPCGVGEIYYELCQAEADFGEVEYKQDENCLAVTTDPITLEGVYLGPFEIRLLLDQVDRPYVEQVLRVVALEPHPAATNSAVTHPHVSDERLCPAMPRWPCRMPWPAADCATSSFWPVRC